METKEKFLNFNLGAKDTAVISLKYITEVLQISFGEICAVPQMPSCILGIYNWRGEMLWLVDLEEMLGYSRISPATNYLSKMMAMVVQTQEKSLGLLVRQPMDIEWLDTRQMKPIDTQLFSPEMASFLQGYFINTNEAMIIGLDVSAIIKAPLWAVHN